MDPEGYIPVSLIASFPRLQALTSDHTVVIDAIRSSDKLEMNHLFKVRTKTEPTKWPIPDKVSHRPGSAPAMPPPIIPPPPLIHSFAPLPSFVSDSPLFQQSSSARSHYENLNPNVPEFVPVNVAGNAEEDISEAEEITEKEPGTYIFIPKIIFLHSVSSRPRSHSRALSKHFSCYKKDSSVIPGFSLVAIPMRSCETFFFPRRSKEKMSKRKFYFRL